MEMMKNINIIHKHILYHWSSMITTKRKLILQVCVLLEYIHT
nr:MAG TPA: hypothetical protein [Caudoviricetes sp.]